MCCFRNGVILTLIWKTSIHTTHNASMLVGSGHASLHMSAGKLGLKLHGGSWGGGFGVVSGVSNNEQLHVQKVNPCSLSLVETTFSTILSMSWIVIRCNISTFNVTRKFPNNINHHSHHLCLSLSMLQHCS